jgi:hypothetical protein
MSAWRFIGRRLLDVTLVVTVGTLVAGVMLWALCPEAWVFTRTMWNLRPEGLEKQLEEASENAPPSLDAQFNWQLDFPSLPEGDDAALGEWFSNQPGCLWMVGSIVPRGASSAIRTK